ncbi:MAG TPA: class I SAM-dependent methyltransferase [Cyclobacteriaceae bacterium]|nr:class I SAM-dependent methyltransferase [Cyclobacteriaceae bacterium]
MNEINLPETFYFVEGVYFQHGLDKKEAFEKKYLSIREKENRIYSDDQVSKLPEISSTHPHFLEWQMRKESMYRLLYYLKSKKIKRILDIGCGNGWLSSHLAKTKAEVFALDINEIELKQGSRVFKEMNNLTFLYADVLSNPFKNENLFDLIVVSSAIQYFPDVRSLLSSLQLLLSDQGEIHILDSPVYQSKTEAVRAKKRSEEYFNSMGHAWMNYYYFHHTIDQFRLFNFKILYDPASFFSRLKNRFVKASPFPWIVIPKSGHP